MAAFSKQYCKLQDPDYPWDFDILEEASKMANHTMINIICEGFGFSRIGKKGNGEIVLGFIDHEKETLEWKSYKDVVTPKFFEKD